MLAFDTNWNGRVDRREWVAFHARADTNDDGVVDEREWRRAMRRATATDAAPAPGEPVPALRADRLDGGTPVSLREPKRPTVLLFGSWTCDVFAGHAEALRALHARYRDRADFYLVYTREAHPVDGGRPSRRVKQEQTHTMEDRRRVASRCVKALGLDMPVLLDDLDDSLVSAYNALPERAFAIDAKGRIAWRSAHGPRGLDLGELATAIESLVGEGD